MGTGDGGDNPAPGDDKTGSTVSKCLFCKATCCSLSLCLLYAALRENKKVSLPFLIEYKRYFFK